MAEPTKEGKITLEVTLEYEIDVDPEMADAVAEDPWEWADEGHNRSSRVEEKQTWR